MPEEIKSKMWVQVPTGHFLVIRIRGTTAEHHLGAVLGGMFGREGGEGTPVRQILDTQGEEFRMRLVPPNRYALRIELAYLTAADAEIHAHIEDADANQFQDALDTTISRPKDAAEIVFLGIATVAVAARDSGPPKRKAKATRKKHK
jgi:hypothetical protein